MTFLPITLDRVSVHVERQEIKGLTEQECRQFRIEAKRDRIIKARCIRENLSVPKGRE